MTNDQIIELAKQAGFTPFDSLDERLQRFAELVRAEVLNAVQVEVAQSPLISNVATAEVQSILRKLK